MTNTKLLNDRIRRKGVKKKYLAERLGVSRTTLCSLIYNKSEFKASQIKTLCEILDIQDNETMQAIFFAVDGA